MPSGRVRPMSYPNGATDLVAEAELDALSLFALALRDLLRSGQDRGLTRQEIEGMLYEALARLGGGLGVRMHGLDQTQVAALKDYFYERTGMNAAGLAASEIYGRHASRLMG